MGECEGREVGTRGLTALRFFSPSPSGKSESKAAGCGRSPSSFL
jgi:hypothetical protein